MTREEYWRKLVEKNPDMETAPTTFQPGTLRRFFEQVWARASDATKAAPADPAVADLMGKMGIGT